MSEKVVWDSKHEYPTEYVVSFCYPYSPWTDTASFSTKDEAISYARTLIRTMLEEEDAEIRARVTKVVKDW